MRPISMTSPQGLCASLALLLASLLTAMPAAAADPIAIDEALLSMASPSLWPGFEAQRVPLAIFDGENTYLFRHFKPPVGFSPVSGRSRTSQFVGRHPAITANSSAEIGGRMCATLMAETAAGDARQAAAVAIHEAFHVFQRENHPSWQGNELDLLIYPFDDANVLTLRLLETDALRRALQASTDSNRACWATAARMIRRDRFRLMPSSATAYERGSELNEGLARYVEGRALEEAPDPAATFQADEIRGRTYWTGQVLATLLDRLDADWKTYLTEDDDKNLDALLANALARVPPKGICDFSEAERGAAQGAAEAAVAQLETRRQQQRAELLGSGGWTVVLESPDLPLQAAGFDPSNLQITGDGEILHERYLKLENGEGSVEILGLPAFTHGAGDHPLAEGVRKITIPALSSEPNVRLVGDVVTLQGQGFSGRFKPARLRKAGKNIFIRLGEKPLPKPVDREPGVPEPPES